jgi:hypothetical protein
MLLKSEEKIVLLENGPRSAASIPNLKISEIDLDTKTYN